MNTDLINVTWRSVVSRDCKKMILDLIKPEKWDALSPDWLAQASNRINNNSLTINSIREQLYNHMDGYLLKEEERRIFELIRDAEL